MDSRKLMNSRMSRVEDSRDRVISINKRSNLKLHWDLPASGPRLGLACNLPPHRANEGPMLNTIWLFSLVTTPIGSPSIQPVSADHQPRVGIWPDRGASPYTGGQGVRAHFRADLDAFVTILRVATRGRGRGRSPRQ